MKENGYFASGMQDEILTRLAGIRDLKVISRTSTAQYASHPPNLKSVGEQLGVTAVLEGSVQHSGEVAHINVQLIDTQSDGHSGPRATTATSRTSSASSATWRKR